MNTFKLAAIDIGSNTIRLLIMNVLEDGNKTYFKKSSLVRVPVRLGEDTFNTAHISLEKEALLIKSLSAFKNLMEIHQVKAYRACATSAMREANNGEEVVEHIKEKTGIAIDIIDGKTAAAIVFDNKVANNLDKKKNYLYVNVGGGSTDIILFSKGKFEYSASFDIGTLKIRDNKVLKSEFIRLKENLIDISSLENIEVIGSGGDINKLVKLTNTAKSKQMSFQEIKNIFEELNNLSVEERMIKYGINANRAEVIIPAATIFLSIMEWVKASEIHVPQIGIADGIIHQLYQNYKEK